MTHTERSPKTPRTDTGIFATLRVSLHSRGGGASSVLRLRRALFVNALALLTLALAATPALANQARLFSGSFGAASSTTPNPYPLSTELLEPSRTGIGVDSSSGPSAHDIYVADPPNHRVEKFDPEGNFLLMFGKEVNKTKVEEAGSTAAERNLCTLASGDQCQAGAAGSSPGAFEEHVDLFLAVDSSKGPSAGDVYVADPGDDLVSKFDPSGNLIATWGSGGQLDGSSVTSPPAPLPGPFGALRGLAVDPSGNLWVLGTGMECIEENPCVHPSPYGRMFEFKQDATFLTDWRAAEAGGAVAAVAADSEGDLLFGMQTLVVKYDPSGTRIGGFDEEGNATIEGLAVDPSTDELYLDWGTFGSKEGAIRRYDSSCHFLPNGHGDCPLIESFGSNRLSDAGAIAIDPSSPTATLYAVERSGQVLAFDRRTVPDAVTAKATSFTSTSATLNGSVNPDGQPLTECFFEWGESTEPYEHTAPCVAPGAAEVGAGTSPVPVHAAVSGLQSGKTYHFRLVAANANDVNALIDEPSLGSDIAFGPPLLESESVSGVSATSASFQAEVNPQNVDTVVKVEYGTDTGYGQSTPEVDLGSAGAIQNITQHIQGLLPHTVYHYRVVTENALGAVTGEDRTFTTQTPAPFALPDNRAWELVSPPDKRGAALYSIVGGAAVQAAASGNAMTYFASSPTEAQPQGFGFSEQLLSARGPGGWSSRDIAAPHREAVGITTNNGQEDALFSPDLSLAAIQPQGAFEPSLSPGASEQTPYLRTNFAAGDFCTSDCYRPLLSACPPEGEPCPPDVEEAADVFPAGTHFSTAGKCPPNSGLTCGPDFLGASPDLSHIVLASNNGIALTPTGGTLYEWSAEKPPAERLQSVSVLPAGEGGGAVAGELGGGGVGEKGGRRAGAISTDGSRVVWLHEVGSENSHLYLRDTAKGETGETVRLDAVQPGASGEGAPEPSFQFASADGSRVFFTDSQALTADSGAEGSAGEAKRDLYECEIVENSSGELQCELTDLTPLSGGEHAAVRGLALGGAEDGSYAYFVANGALAAGAEPGQPNLYVSHDGATKLVAVLSSADVPDWAGKGIGNIEEMSARVSPSGRWLAFMSQRPLTGYDNRDALTGERDEEVYLYDAQSERLLCASCDPTGARPLGNLSAQVGDHNPEEAFLGTHYAWSQVDLAALLPGWTLPTYQSRYLSDSGRLFFESLDALAPQDSNGTWDVYQYEPPQGGESPPSDTCTPASTTYSPASEGCIGLISSGSSSEPSAFLDASESGNDVFFLTAAKLSRRDEDTSYDVYDARVGGGEAEPVKPVECVGDACQRPAVPPTDPTPGSLTFHGAGNVHEPSKAKKPKKHSKKHKHNKSHKRQAKGPANTNRRATK